MSPVGLPWGQWLAARTRPLLLSNAIAHHVQRVPIGGGQPVTVTCSAPYDCSLTGLAPGTTYEVTAASLCTGLDKNNYDKAACEEAFLRYKACKKQEVRGSFLFRPYAWTRLHTPHCSPPQVETRLQRRLESEKKGGIGLF